MGMKWTEEQSKVITLRDRNILVSAAAGSGKTAVLVQRILSKIMDPDRPVDIDRLLIMTFTRAAEGEMKERISNAIDYDRIYNWLEYSRTELPHMCDVLKKLPLPDDRQKAVYVMHMPPAGLRLGQLRYQDLDIGSVDIYEFLKEKQPLLSLHGHIHESPDTEKGKWINQIHQTTCIQTGQTELNDKYMVYAEIDLQEKKYERKVISVD